MLKSLDSFIDITKNISNVKIAVAAAEDLTTLTALREITKKNIAEPILVGDKDMIESICAIIDYDVSKFQIINIKNKIDACRTAVELVKSGYAHVLTRGAIETPDYLRPILNKEHGLKISPLVSQAAFVEIPSYSKVFAFTDSGINISPDVNDKAQMIRQCVSVFHRLGVMNPKVAVIAATEGVKTVMPSTVDAALLTQMNRRGSIPGCIVDGPLSIDLAFSKESAIHKGIISEVAGDVDLIVLPDINAANIFYKTATFLGRARAASFIIGTSAPVDFPSRSDSVETKFYAIVCAVAQCSKIQGLDK